MNIINSTAVQIQCLYLAGVVIPGCVYALVHVQNGKSNVTGEILRSNQDVKTVVVDSIGCYDELLVTVVESGATSALSLPKRIKINNNISYYPCTEGNNWGTSIFVH